MDTASLDGETMLRMRQTASPLTQRWQTEIELARACGYVEFELPSSALYLFRGALVLLQSGETPQPVRNESPTHPAPWRLCIGLTLTLASAFGSYLPATAIHTHAHLQSACWYEVDESRKCCLSASSILLRGASLRDTAFVHGIVIYTGGDTKLARSSALPRVRFSYLESQVNRAFLVTLAAVVSLAAASVIVHSAL